MASSSSSLGTLHLSPSIMVFIHIESCDAFSFDAWRCSFIVRILDKASGTFMLRLTIRFRLVVAVFVMIGSCGAGLRKKSSFDVGKVNGSCSWGFSEEFCNGGRIRDDVGSWVLSVDSKDEADADAVGDDALGEDDGGFLERPPHREAMMAMVAAIHAIKRKRESAGWWWVNGLASEGNLLPMVEINMNQDLSLSLSRPTVGEVKSASNIHDERNAQIARQADAFIALPDKFSRSCGDDNIDTTRNSQQTGGFAILVSTVVAPLSVKEKRIKDVPISVCAGGSLQF
ncbi:hypothetical protein CKAN_00658700 [Cinnamomum micranthum f. kanehirae]|uniref:Uncharacterized protein n=1 Tax=Cinnamomum micranthum f. kanehirae TaxID=337451 RepID=A0A443NHR2_9MAGN|nr:hypothetical protein CKAN_00658700 [Cinnamomum micranthum f. kanehirae]